MELRKPPVREKKIVNGEFSQEFYMNRNELSAFLRNLADQVESEEELKIISENWILPFKPVGHAKVDIDLDEDELEIEIEFKKSTGKLITQSPEEKVSSEEEVEYEHTYT